MELAAWGAGPAAPEAPSARWPYYPGPNSGVLASSGHSGRNVPGPLLPGTPSVDVTIIRNLRGKPGVEGIKEVHLRDQEVLVRQPLEQVTLRPNPQFAPEIFQDDADGEGHAVTVAPVEPLEVPIQVQVGGVRRASMTADAASNAGGSTWWDQQQHLHRRSGGGGSSAGAPVAPAASARAVMNDLLSDMYARLGLIPPSGGRQEAAAATQGSAGGKAPGGGSMGASHIMAVAARPVHRHSSPERKVTVAAVPVPAAAARPAAGGSVQRRTGAGAGHGTPTLRSWIPSGTQHLEKLQRSAMGGHAAPGTGPRRGSSAAGNPGRGGAAAQSPAAAKPAAQRQLQFAASPAPRGGTRSHPGTGSRRGHHTGQGGSGKTGMPAAGAQGAGQRRGSARKGSQPQPPHGLQRHGSDGPGQGVDPVLLAQQLAAARRAAAEHLAARRPPLPPLPPRSAFVLGALRGADGAGAPPFPSGGHPARDSHGGNDGAELETHTRNANVGTGAAATDAALPVQRPVVVVTSTLPAHGGGAGHGPAAVGAKYGGAIAGSPRASGCSSSTTGGQGSPMIIISPHMAHGTGQGHCLPEGPGVPLRPTAPQRVIQLPTSPAAAQSAGMHAGLAPARGGDADAAFRVTAYARASATAAGFGSQAHQVQSQGWDSQWVGGAGPLHHPPSSSLASVSGGPLFAEELLAELGGGSEVTSNNSRAAPGPGLLLGQAAGDPLHVHLDLPGSAGEGGGSNSLEELERLVERQHAELVAAGILPDDDDFRATQHWQRWQRPPQVQATRHGPKPWHGTAAPAAAPPVEPPVATVAGAGAAEQRLPSPSGSSLSAALLLAGATDQAAAAAGAPSPSCSSSGSARSGTAEPQRHDVPSAGGGSRPPPQHSPPSAASVTRPAEDDGDEAGHPAWDELDDYDDDGSVNGDSAAERVT